MGNGWRRQTWRARGELSIAKPISGAGERAGRKPARFGADRRYSMTPSTVPTS